MAGYKSHIAFGILTSIGWSIFLLTFSLISIWFLPVVFFFTVIGAFLPDLDSETGLPLKILLMILSLIGSMLVGWITFNSERVSFNYSIGYSLSSFLLIYYGIGGIIKRVTKHRGIFHSIPSVLLSTLITLTFLDYFLISDSIKVLLSLSVGIGYLSHLILDEMNSVVNLEGIPFIPKKSLGTALKFYSNRWKVNILVYSFVIFLFLHNWKIINSFYSTVIKKLLMK